MSNYITKYNMTQVYLNDITRVVKSNSNSHSFPEMNTTSFLQSYSIPINLVSDISKPETITSSSFLKFISNEILEMPEYFSEFMDLNK